MKKLYVSTLCFTLTASLYAAESSFKLDKLQVDTGMKTTVVNAKDLRARVFGFNIDIKVEEKVSSELTFFLDTSINLETGANEATGSIAEYEPKESINLNAGGVSYRPLQSIQVDAGALNQGELNSPLLIGSNAFAGISEKLSYGVFFISASQTIPSNNRLTKRIGTVDDGNPYFAMETVGISFGDKFKFELTGSHYKFTDLSTNVAEKSKEMGNSVEGIGNSTEFLYDFEGINSTLDTSYQFDNSFFVKLTGQYLFNDKAPEGRNKGVLAELEMGKKNLSLSLEIFENGSDTSPAFYNSKYYGHNNMKGSSIGVNSTKNDLTISAKYTTANVMQENFVQTNMNIITLDLVKTYDF